MSTYLQDLHDGAMEWFYSLLKTVLFVSAVGLGVLGGAVFSKPILDTVNHYLPMTEQYLPAKVSLSGSGPPPIMKLSAFGFDNDHRSPRLVL